MNWPWISFDMSMSCQPIFAELLHNCLHLQGTKDPGSQEFIAEASWKICDLAYLSMLISCKHVTYYNGLLSLLQGPALEEIV